MGRLRREPELSFDSAILTLDTERIGVGRDVFRAEGGLRVGVSGEKRSLLRSLAAGDRVRLWARLGEGSSFQNPEGFDATTYRERERLDLVASVKSALLVTGEERGKGLSSSISRLRTRSVERLESSFTRPSDPPVLGVIVALVTGDRSRLTNEIEKTYRRAGVFHVMAISGAHVAIVILAVYFTLRRVAGFDEVPAIGALLLLLPLYALFCGSGAPVVRAVLVAAVVFGARLLSLDRPRGNALALAALLLLAWEPASFLDPGFQLTFSAMGAILWLSEPIGRALSGLGPLSRPLAVSIAAQAGVLPIAAWHFHTMAPVAPPASVIAVPLAGLVVILGLVLVAVAGIGVLAPLVSSTLRLAVWLLNESASFAASLPGASLAIPRPSTLWILSYCGLLALLRHGPARLRVLAAVLLALVLVAPFRDGRTASGRLELTALDVGHGDALVVSLPGGRRLLVDGGGLPGSSFDVGERVVLPYLLDHGGRRLDAVVSTHSDFDHIGGLFAVIEAMEVAEIWEGPPSGERPLHDAFRNEAERRRIPIRQLRAGESFEWDGVVFEVLAAGGVGPASGFDENDRSVVLRLTFGKSRILLTGDAGTKLEQALLESYPDRLEADVLKVGHHGSRGSTSAPFLSAVSPRLAILSVRGGASRPLPARQVLERLRELGVDTLRTDESGAVTVRLGADGGMEVETFVGR